MEHEETYLHGLAACITILVADHDEAPIASGVVSRLDLTQTFHLLNAFTDGDRHTSPATSDHENGCDILVSRVHQLRKGVNSLSPTQRSMRQGRPPMGRPAPW